MQLHTTFSQKCRTVALLTLMIAVSTSVCAIGIIVPRKPDNAAPVLKSIDVSANVKNNIARTRITQVYHNPNSRPVEADFYFPVPDGSDITDFVLYMNGKPVKGEVLGKDEAHDIYRDIVRKMKDPGLVEWAEKNLFRVRIFPIPANGEQKLEIELSQPLTSDQGYYRYYLPMESGRHPAASTPPSSVAIKVRLEADAPVRNVYSPTHEIDTATSDSRSITVTAKGDMADQRKDFILYYEISKKDIAVSLLAHRADDDAGFFSLRISPPWDANATTAPKAQAGDYVFVIDTSGSMAEGDKISQARKALRYCVNLLTETDRFNIIRFSTTVEPYKQELVSASKMARDAAKTWITDLQARGGTNISEALETALKQRTAAQSADSQSTSDPAKRMFTVVFLTDGLPTVGETSPEKIIKTVTEKSGGNVRMFTFGVGNDVNTRLLDSIADATRAASDYVAPEADLEVPVSRFFDKVSRPALFNLELKIPNAGATEIYPVQLPDLFYGTELAVFGRYKTTGSSPIILTGTIAGEKQEYRFEKNFPEKTDDNPFIEKLWATRKVAWLLDQVRKSGESDELRKEIEKLARKYSIVTPYTSFLAMEDKSKAHRPQQRTDKKLAWSFGEFGYNATDGTASAGDVYRTAPGAVALEMESGAIAVQTARKLKSMKAAESLSDTSGNANADQRRTVDGKTFVNKNGTWTDTAISGSETAIVEIQYMSDAWFQLADDFPEMRDYFALGKQVSIRMDNESVLRISSKGIDSIDVETLVKLGLSSK